MCVLQLRVQAYRQNLPSVRARATVRVFVTRNTSPPAFQHGALTFTLSEDQPLGVSIGQVRAQDPDTVSLLHKTINEINLNNIPKETRVKNIFSLLVQ